MVATTTYKPVTFVGKGGGTLKLFDEQLTFQMYDKSAPNGVKIFTLPWSKIQKRQVSSSDASQPKIKLILKSGNESIFQMDDRISLEVLRDDIAERLGRYKAKYPDSDDEAVNQTRSGKMPRRQSTPYRMAKPDLDSPKRASVHAPRESQPYRMAQPASNNNNNNSNGTRGMSQSMPGTSQRRMSTPYRMAAPQKAPTNAPRESQPYRMKQKEPSNEPRTAQPYRFVAKK